MGYYIELENIITGLGFLGAGGLMFFRGRYLNRMSRRSQRYILAIGNTDAMPIEEIAKRVNRTPSQAIKEMEKLIDKGYLGEDAYIDRQRGYFLRFGATLEEEPAPVREAPPTPKEAEEGYSGILRNIRHANDRIADPELSRKIERIEQVTALIFREVEEHPEKRGRIHTFFDYYLPTTQKLLDTYAEFEETGVEGENLRQTKERIEQTMDMIVDGFEHQLDSSTPPTPWTWSATSRFWRPCSTGTPPRLPRTSATPSRPGSAPRRTGNRTICSSCSCRGRRPKEQARPRVRRTRGLSRAFLRFFLDKPPGAGVC